MPDLIITVPLDKVQLVRDMVEHRNNTPDMLDQDIIDYAVWMLTQQLKRWCQEQQQADLYGTFVFDDPVP
jgi:hypothetical protein